MSQLFRNAILASSGNRHVARFVRKHGMRLGAGRFVAGEDLDECVAVLRRLNSLGLKANTTLLGEAVTNVAETAQVVEAYEDILNRIELEQLKANVALKLTHLGLDIDEELAFANIARLADRAAECRNFLRIDMEQSSTVDPTLRVYRRLRDSGRDNVGVVLQSYLHRSEADLRTLIPLRPNVRLVKGAYLEPASVAFPRKDDVDGNYTRLVELSLRESAYTAVATHDERLIEHTMHVADRDSIGRDRFEFQMLYGVRPKLQQRLRASGYEVLVATPFGPEWFPYLTRRLAERPANLLFLLKNLVRR